MTRFHYSGDVNAENGGFFYETANTKYRFANVYRITPWSDAGGPDNVFLLEALTVNLPDRATLCSADWPAFQFCGVTQDQLDMMTADARDRAAIECATNSGHGVDTEQTRMVQIGPDEGNARQREEVARLDCVRLRAGTLIRNYTRNVFMKEV